MRQTFDDLWIIDLGGDNLGTRKTPNVFSIQTPVAIAIGMRGAHARRSAPATVRYAKIEASTSEAKLGRLDDIENYAGLEWRDCPSDWHAPFLPAGNSEFFEWPPLIDLFPWQYSGVQFKRVWPIGETKEVLRRRWDRLANSHVEERKKLFRETSGRRIDRTYRNFSNDFLLKLSEISRESDSPPLRRYCYRLFDRQYAIIDNRLCDRPRRPLVLAAGQGNLFFSSLISETLGAGAAIGVSADLPDLHVFRGSFGGKDVIPLYRDREGGNPNITGGLLDALGAQYDRSVVAEDLAAYVYALLGGQSYTRRFWNELETPGPRVPVTSDGTLFDEAAALGRRLIWLHTYAERYRGDDRGSAVPAGQARCTAAVSDDPARYPENFARIETERAIRVGTGRFGPVAREVWDFEVSGLKVVQSWLGYRRKKRAGRKSSPLDDIRPEYWTARMSEEFLELLWVLEATLAMEPDLERTLDRVVSGPCFLASGLPQPTLEQRQAPIAAGEAGGLFEELEIEIKDAN